MLKLQSDLCYGCTACVSICPTKCIEMVDSGEGFLIPKLKSEAQCINCDLCNRVCPAVNIKEEKPQPQKGYIVQNTDEKIRKESTSGGAFSAIAAKTIKDGGVVYGAAYDQDYNVVHVCIEDEKDLWKLRNSKYVQSELRDTFNTIKNQLEKGIKVCFSGTPCQVEGLSAFLKKDYENLISVDVVCHGIGSPLIWRKYLELQNGKLPAHIYFRWKHYGYKYSTMSFLNEGKETYFAGVESDPMLRAYFTNNCDRKTCYNCAFKKRYRVADITIWDCFQPKIFDKSFDDDKGTTSVLIHSKKGSKTFDEVLGENTLKYCEVEPDELVFGNNEMVNSVVCGKERDGLLRDAKTMTSQELFSKYFPNSFASRVKKTIRIFLLKSGMYRKVKYVLFLIRRKKQRNISTQKGE
ncbi:MAG: 4Fe-4S dicluster domain-containing protein [Ruminococcaceae bacterium]|nr:4Fe-4S dicluster domain-containing protein [Oscillospiraceae bacterium]